MEFGLLGCGDVPAEELMLKESPERQLGQLDRQNIHSDLSHFPQANLCIGVSESGQ